MNTRIVKIQEENMDEGLLREAGEILLQGGLVAFPTETVYGLGGDALNPESARKIYAAKGRPSDNPLIVHISKWQDIYPIVARVPEEAEKIARAFWPGPLTMILEKSARVPYETTGGLDTVAVRMPSHPVAGRLIEYGGGFIAAPSANSSGKPSPTLARYVEEDMDGRIDMILDGGEVGIGLESTIIDLTVSPPQILRPGFVTQEMLEAVLGKVEADIAILRADSGQAPKAPGMKYRHYAPKGELTIVSGNRDAVVDYINRQAAKAKAFGTAEDWGKASGLPQAPAIGKKTGIIATDETMSGYRADTVKSVGSRLDEASIGRRLYRILREFDEENIDIIYSESFDTGGFGQAIMNRLLKAAGHRVIEV